MSWPPPHWSDSFEGALDPGTAYVEEPLAYVPEAAPEFDPFAPAPAVETEPEPDPFAAPDTSALLADRAAEMAPGEGSHLAERDLVDPFEQAPVAEPERAPFETPSDLGVNTRLAAPLPEATLGHVGTVDAAGPEAVPYEDRSTESLQADADKETADHAAEVVRLEEESLAENRRLTTEAENRRAGAVDEAKRKYMQIEAESKKLASTEIGWNPTFGQRVAAIIAATVGGIDAPFHGGRNAGLEGVMKAIEMDINTQRLNLQNKKEELGRRKNLVGELLAAGMDEAQAINTLKVASLQQYEQAVAVERAKYAAGGTTDARLELKQREAAAAREAAQAQALRDQIAWETEQADKVSQIEKRDLDMQIAGRKAQLEEAAAMRKLRGGSGRSSNKPPTFQQRMTMADKGLEPFQHPDGTWDVRQKGGSAGGLSLGDFRSMTPEQQAQVPPHEVERLTKLAELAKGDSMASEHASMAAIKESEAEGAGSKYTIGGSDGAPIKNKDGSRWVITDDTARGEMRTLYDAAKNLTRMSDLIAIMRKEEGGTHRFSKAEQEFRSLAAMVNIETFKAFGLGAPSAGDMKLAEDAAGGKDITSYLHSPEVGYQAFARGVRAKANSQAKTLGFTGDELPMPRMRLAEAYERAPEELESAIFSTKSRPDKTPDQEAADRSDDITVWLRHNPTAAQVRDRATEMQKAVLTGELDESVARQVFVQTSIPAAREWKARVQGMSTAELREAQKDPDFVTKSRAAGAVLFGKAHTVDLDTLVDLTLSGGE